MNDRLDIIAAAVAVVAASPAFATGQRASLPRSTRPRTPPAPVTAVTTQG